MIVGILIVLMFLLFYTCVHQFGVIKKCLDTVARCKHEDCLKVLDALGFRGTRLHSSKSACEHHVRPFVSMFQRDSYWTDLREK